MTRDRSLDIAITGLYARLPGPEDPRTWWTAVCAGETLTTRFTPEELSSMGVPDHIAADPAYVPVRGRIEDAERFDAELFGIGPREAQLTDPQHRLMLEAAWAALEDAGRDPRADGLRTAVFASSSPSRYGARILANPGVDAEVAEAIAVGGGRDFMATRLAYRLGLTGPAISVLTACSSSLVAVHLAVQALNSGDCDQAVVVAASVGYPQAGHMHFRGGIMTADGTCRPFDADASGTVGGSGVVAVVLRRLGDVLVDAGTHGVILGSAVNNDGSIKAGFSAPSAAGQAAVIRAALEAGDVRADTLGYVEAHGTGTYIGDPIEWSSTSAALRAAGVAGRRIAVGAVKANIGHLDAASGLAGLVKTLRVLKHGQIPPIAHFRRLNPLLAEIDSPLYVPTADEQWRGEGPRRAGINSFGIGGTNAHVIVEEPPAVAPLTNPEPDRPSIVVLSSVRPDGAGLAAVRLAEHLSEHDVDPLDVAHTLRVGRSPLPYRLAVVGRSRADLIRDLRDDRSGRRLSGRPHGETPRPLIVLLPGQGAQRPGMALAFRDLAEFSPTVDKCLSHLDAATAATVRRALWDLTFPAGRLKETLLAQPALFVLQYAVVRALADLGVRADAYAGHSLGELTAICLSGALDLPTALDLVLLRAAAMQSSEPGGMLAVTCGEDEARELCADGPCEVAAVNGATGCVLSGPVEAIADLERLIGARIPSRRLHTNRAFHSAAMEPAAAALRAHLAGRTSAPVKTPFIGNRDATLHATGTRISLDLLADSVRATVRFADGVATLAAAFPDALAIEIGPGRALSGIVAASGLTTMPPAVGDADNAARGLAWLWANGHPVDLASLVPGGRLLHLPVTVFGGARHVAPEAGWSTTEPDGPGVIPPVAPTKQPGPPAEFVEHAWRELLGVCDLNPESDFYALGGDSVITVHLRRRLEQAYDIEIPMRDLVLARALGEQIQLVEHQLEDDHE